MAAAALLYGCSANVEQPEGKENETTVNLSFTPYEVSPITRASAPISDYVSHLDVWLLEGENVMEAHQSSNDDGFGSVQFTLNNTKTYTLYAVGHKCSGNATLSNSVVRFPDDKVTHTFFYTTTFSPATTTSLNCVMNRIVGMFRLETTDNVPDNVVKIDYSIANTFTRWNVSGNGVNAEDRTASIAIPSANVGKPVALMVYIIPSNLTATDYYTITMTAKTSTDAVVEEKTFADVPIKANYKTVYRGAFFTTDNMTMQFTADDWQEFDSTEF